MKVKKFDHTRFRPGDMIAYEDSWSTDRPRFVWGRYVKTKTLSLRTHLGKNRMYIKLGCLFGGNNGKEVYLTPDQVVGWKPKPSLLDDEDIKEAFI